MITGAVRWAAAKVDANVVSPVTNRLVTSVANPFVLSYFIWERLKAMTPQRARDLSRLLSTAITNAANTLNAEKGAALKATTRRLQDDVVGAAVSREGRDVVLNVVATASKVAQALNTPEARAATAQGFETLQSVLDLLASATGRRALATTSACVVQLCDVAASPEASIFLAEVATNICHALDTEAARRDAAETTAAAAACAQDDEPVEKDSSSSSSNAAAAAQQAPLSPTWSTADTDTAFETESNVSDAAFGHGNGLRSRFHTPSAAAAMRIEQPAQRHKRHKHEKRAGVRSARIERDVLLKMGVSPAMIGEIQRILETAAADDEQQQMQCEDDAASQFASEFEYQTYDDDGDDSDGAESTISNAFGFATLPSTVTITQSDETNATTERIVRPEWHNASLAQALRQRHVQDDARIAGRNTMETHARDMAAVLATQRVQLGAHSEMTPTDVLACRMISQLLVLSVAVILLLVVASVAYALLVR